MGTLKKKTLVGTLGTLQMDLTNGPGMFVTVETLGTHGTLYQPPCEPTGQFKQSMVECLMLASVHGVDTRCNTWLLYTLCKPRISFLLLL